MILVTSFSELSGRMGMAILPKGTIEKNATDQFGILCERIATLSPELIPYCVSNFEIESACFLKEAKVYPPSFVSYH